MDSPDLIIDSVLVLLFVGCLFCYGYALPSMGFYMCYKSKCKDTTFFSNGNAFWQKKFLRKKFRFRLVISKKCRTFALAIERVTVVAITMVHSSSGLGRRPLTPKTRVRLPDALPLSSLAGFLQTKSCFFLFPHHIILSSPQAPSSPPYQSLS